MSDNDLDKVPAELEYEDSSEFKPNRAPLIWLASVLGVAVLTLSIVLPVLLATSR